MSKPIDYVAEGEENEALRWRDAEIASLRVKLAAVCKAGETLASDVLDLCDDPYCDGPRCLACFAMKAAIAAAREGEK